jgi:hypothetical protein
MMSNYAGEIWSRDATENLYRTAEGMMLETFRGKQGKRVRAGSYSSMSRELPPSPRRRVTSLDEVSTIPEKTQTAMWVRAILSAIGGIVEGMILKEDQTFADSILSNIFHFLHSLTPQLEVTCALESFQLSDKSLDFQITLCDRLVYQQFISMELTILQPNQRLPLEYWDRFFDACEEEVEYLTQHILCAKMTDGVVQQNHQLIAFLLQRLNSWKLEGVLRYLREKVERREFDYSSLSRLSSLQEKLLAYVVEDRVAKDAIAYLEKGGENISFLEERWLEFSEVFLNSHLLVKLKGFPFNQKHLEQYETLKSLYQRVSEPFDFTEFFQHATTFFMRAVNDHSEGKESTLRDCYFEILKIFSFLETYLNKDEERAFEIERYKWIFRALEALEKLNLVDDEILDLIDKNKFSYFFSLRYKDIIKKMNEYLDDLETKENIEMKKSAITLSFEIRPERVSMMKNWGAKVELLDELVTLLNRWQGYANKDMKRRNNVSAK